MGAALQILRASEDAKAERENDKNSRATRSELFNLSDPDKVWAQHVSTAVCSIVKAPVVRRSRRGSM